MGAPNPDVSALVAELALQYWTVANTPDLTAVVSAVTSQLSRLGGEINSAVTAFAQTQVTAVFTAEEATEEAHGGPAAVVPPPTPSGNIASLAEVRAYYSSSVAQVVVSGTIIDFQTLETDTDSAVTIGANWRFTCPVGKAGTYIVAAAWNTNAINALQLFLNGALAKFLTSAAAFTTGFGTIAIDLTDGDFIDLRANAAGTMGGGATLNWVRIFSN